MKSEVSVIVPNYNHSSFLQQRLESIAKQTYPEFECKILDDCSTDNSREIIEAFVEKQDRFSLSFNNENSGSTFQQWHKGIELSENDLVWIAESDDEADPEFLSELLPHFENDPEVVLVYCQSYRTNEAGEITGSWKSYTDDLDKDLFASDFTMDGKEFIEKFLIHKNVIPNASAVIFRKSVFKTTGGIPEFLKSNGDWLAWLKILCLGKVVYVSKSLNYFRRHKSSVIARVNQNYRVDEYKEQYDFSMRKEFSRFLKERNINLPRCIIKDNEKYMAYDRGNKGLFLLKNNRFLKGWINILDASINPKIQTGYIKKAFEKL